MQQSLVQRAIEAYGRAILTIDPVRVRLWEDQGLTVLQLRLVHMLLANDRMSVGHLAAELNTTPASMTGLMDRLAVRGLVRREHDPDDHRVVRLTLTPKGRRMVEELQTAAAGYLAQVFEKMAGDMLASLVDCLEAFCSAAQAVRAERPTGGSK
ncbi:MAG TPA: MarR family transcriptional regulator [Dehalococcoidia bacterium]|nr:MarR family transcriptional regulator [Dehalococcoidia bacterium]